MHKHFTLMEVLMATALIATLTALAMPAFIRAQRQSQTTACINNLRHIDGAKQQWSMERRAAPTAIPTGEDLQPYLGRSSGGRLPVCPADPARTFETSYQVNDLRTIPSCLINSINHFCE